MAKTVYVIFASFEIEAEDEDAAENEVREQLGMADYTEIWTQGVLVDGKLV